MKNTFLSILVALAAFSLGTTSVSAAAAPLGSANVVYGGPSDGATIEFTSAAGVMNTDFGIKLVSNGSGCDDTTYQASTSIEYTGTYYADAAGTVSTGAAYAVLVRGTVSTVAADGWSLCAKVSWFTGNQYQPSNVYRYLFGPIGIPAPVVPAASSSNTGPGGGGGGGGGGSYTPMISTTPIVVDTKVMPQVAAPVMVSVSGSTIVYPTQFSTVMSVGVETLSVDPKYADGIRVKVYRDLLNGRKRLVGSVRVEKGSVKIAYKKSGKYSIKF